MKIRFWEAWVVFLRFFLAVLWLVCFSTFSNAKKPGQRGAKNCGPGGAENPGPGVAKNPGLGGAKNPGLGGDNNLIGPNRA